jgi:hypothetical protein
MTYKSEHFELSSDVKNLINEMNPHNYWCKEILWLILLFFYNRYSLTGKVSNLLIIIAIEIAYMRALRFGDLKNIKYS